MLNPQGDHYGLSFFFSGGQHSDPESPHLTTTGIQQLPDFPLGSNPVTSIL